MKYLNHIIEHLDSNKLNDPFGYINYLKSHPRFKDATLENLPKKAIILHDTRLEEHLAILGISSNNIRPVRTGTTDPNLLYVVYGETSDQNFIINRGLPGGGGITTIAAELVALGVEEMVHIGTCAFMGEDVPSNSIIVSKGSYKDLAAVQLSNSVDGDVEPIALPDTSLSDEVFASLAKLGQTPVLSTGYTISSFYFQPESLIRSLVTNKNLPGSENVGHLEMEQAGFFSVAALMKVKSASITLGSDRYLIDNGALIHKFEDDFDQDKAEQISIKAVLNVFQS